MGAAPVAVTGAVEGLVDEAVFRRLVKAVGAIPGQVYGKRGKAHLLQALTGYNKAARFSPWLVIVDLDDDEDCAPPLREKHLAKPESRMCFRVAVREIEAWLLADPERLSRLLEVEKSWLPANPDGEKDPKKVVVDLARKSRSGEIRRDLVPRAGSGRVEGPAYTSRLVEFVSDARRGWRPLVAARRSDSLYRCFKCLNRIAKASRGRKR